MATDPERQRQHLVSRGYQQNFADDHRVAVLDAQTGATLDPRRPTRSNWRVDDFLTVVDPTGHRDDSLEREFAKTERATLGQIRDITRTRISLEQRRALDLLAAVHLVRSESFVAVHGQVTDAFFDNWPADYIADSRTRLQELFVADRGRQPEPGELQNLVDALTRKFQASPDLTANGMRHVTAGIPRLLARYRVQLVEAPSWMSGFVLADQPVVHARPDEGRYGFASQLAVGDADLIMVPIKRRLLPSTRSSRLQIATSRWRPSAAYESSTQRSAGMR